MSTEKIRSDMATDPDLIELLQEFVSNIPERIRTIRERMEAHDRPMLCTLIHQLRGACGSYGYHQMTPMATHLEIALRSNAQLDELERLVNEFLDACSRMTSDAS